MKMTHLMSVAACASILVALAVTGCKHHRQAGEHLDTPTPPPKQVEVIKSTFVNPVAKWELVIPSGSFSTLDIWKVCLDDQLYIMTGSGAITPVLSATTGGSIPTACKSN